MMRLEILMVGRSRIRLGETIQKQFVQKITFGKVYTEVVFILVRK